MVVAKKRFYVGRAPYKDKETFFPTVRAGVDAAKRRMKRTKYSGPLGEQVRERVDDLLTERFKRAKFIFSFPKTVALTAGFGFVAGGAGGVPGKGAAVGAISGVALHALVGVIYSPSDIRFVTRQVGHLMCKEVRRNSDFRKFLETNRGRYLLVDGKGKVTLTRVRNPFGRIRLSISKILADKY